MPPDRPGRDVYVIGNMASGKTTLSRLLAARIRDAVYVPEPVAANPFLPLYLQDQARWGMSCMARYFLDYLEEWARATGGGCRYAYHFVDAGTPSNRWLYGRYLHEDRIISEAEYRLYSDVCEAAARAARVPEPHAFIYVRAAPGTCWARMRARGWGFQVAAVDLAYIGRLHYYLEAMAGLITGQGYPLLILSSEELDYLAPAGQAAAVAQVSAFLGFA